MRTTAVAAVGYANDKMVLDWMNTTEPDNPESLPTQPVIVNRRVELPQFEVTRSASTRCEKRYHQKSGQ